MNDNPVKQPGDRPFPWRCWNCRKNEVFREAIPYSIDVNHDGQVYQVEIPNLMVPKCRNCGEITFDHNADDQVTDALRTKIGLLMPEEIRARRMSLGLTPAELSLRIGYPEDTLEKIEGRFRVQSRALDTMLRVYFAFPNVREALNGGIPDRNLGLVELSATEK
jgi:DNA-binding transcriptional regulator YiaG